MVDILGFFMGHDDRRMIDRRFGTIGATSQQFIYIQQK